MSDTTMHLHSPAFNDHMPIPSRYSHERGDISPPLVWSEIPDGTAELALVCEDPDAPGGGLEAGRAPEGAVAGRNGFGAPSYGGPHPPPGDKPHRYFFRLYALPEHSDLRPGFTADELIPLRNHALTTASLVGMYNR